MTIRRRSLLSIAAACLVGIETDSDLYHLSAEPVRKAD